MLVAATKIDTMQADSLAKKEKVDKLNERKTSDFFANSHGKL